MQRREKKIETFIHINDTNFDKSIYNIIKQETDGCNMRVWGNITIYVGRIKREKCIESIVAVTRAKYRLYVIGDKDAWKKSSCVSLLMEELEKYQHNYSNSIRTALTVTKSAPYALTGMETQKDGITFDCLVQSKQTY